jgi:hypothetical protein
MLKINNESDHRNLSLVFYTYSVQIKIVEDTLKSIHQDRVVSCGRGHRWRKQKCNGHMDIRLTSCSAFAAGSVVDNGSSSSCISVASSTFRSVI